MNHTSPIVLSTVNTMCALVIQVPTTRMPLLTALVRRLTSQRAVNVAVVISRHRPAGVDIENNNIAWKVAQRFYSNDEITAIQLLPITQRDIIAKLLWQIKESFIKIYQYTVGCKA